MKKDKLKLTIKEILSELLTSEGNIIDKNNVPFTVSDNKIGDVAVIYFKDEDVYLLSQKTLGKQNNIKISKKQLQEILKETK